MLEREIEKYLIKKMKEISAICWKLALPGARGVPDRLILYSGQIVFVELKVRSKKLRPQQEKRKKELLEQGFSIIVIDSKKGVDDLRNYLIIRGKL